MGITGCGAGDWRASQFSAADLSASWIHHVLNNVHDALGPAVENDRDLAQQHTMITAGKAWQPPVKVNRKWTNAFLQARRQSAITFQVFLQARRQITTTFSQTRGQIRRSTAKIVANDLPVMDAEGDVDRAAIIIMGIAFAMTLAVALRKSNLGRERDTERALGRRPDESLEHDHLRPQEKHIAKVKSLVP